jgi:hypothetical protein
MKSYIYLKLIDIYKYLNLSTYLKIYILETPKGDVTSQ